MKAPHARREISGACVLNEGAAPAAATRSSPRTARPPDSRPRAQVQILAHGVISEQKSNERVPNALTTAVGFGSINREPP